MIEVCLFTALLGLAMEALPGLTVNNGNVDAPGHPGVRDYMLRYMADVFVSHSLGAAAGHVAAWTVSIVFGFLLLSAVNTAIVDLIAISFLMSRDGELPAGFQKLNKFGVPNLGIIAATVVPAILVVVVKDMEGLADLYAVGVVGAIATNLGASSTDWKLGLARWERLLMFCTFLIMLAIEVSLFVDKPDARFFAGTILLVGLILRGLASERSGRQKKAAEAAEAARIAAAPPVAVSPPTTFSYKPDMASGSPMICAVRGVGKTMEFAIQEAQETHRPLYLLFVRAVPILSQEDYKRKWQDDSEAREVFLEAKKKAAGHPVFPCYAVSDAVAHTIVDITATTGASYLILGAPERRGLLHLLRGNIIREISDNLPDDIHLLVYA
jgi:nucleotide-binding universal stress UspA family protein